MSEPIAQVNKPIQLTWRNRRVRSKENNDGEFFYIVEFEFDEEAWGFLKTIPRNANGEMVIWVTEVGMVKEKPARKPKDPKGPFSYFWEYLHPGSKHGGAGFISLPGVREAVEEIRVNESQGAWDLLHQLFGVVTLAHTSDSDVLAKFPNNPPVQIAVDRAMAFQKEKEKQ